ncbi:Galactosyl transferase GMA12/MNN10 family protein [Actinidia rufa]|uniref:Galactosyl transferase GMA12/MNN10 family protein n=1 Tax=Actinidia rufa TaxID=165716 RepID=A0A7J0E3H1_9ERIC|nr:Galactosyl transferase GMA12/MNN10 family protein [Actinidia rufa]
MERTKPETNPSSFLRNKSILIGATAILALLMVWSLRSNVSTSSVSAKKPKATVPSYGGGWPGSGAVSWCANIRQKTFYDDPNLSYSIEKPIRIWDEKETAPTPRIYDVFYNNALLHPKMGSFWAKIPVVRAAMVAHPEAEWIWWVDSDAVFTDMDFVPPLESGLWTSWKRGPRWVHKLQITKKWGHILKSTIKDKLYPESDDQTAMVYLLLKEKDKWANKVFLEHEHCIQGYWEGLVSTLDNITRNYVGLEKKARPLRRRHAEKVSESYGAQWELYLEAAGLPERRREAAMYHALYRVLRNYGFVHADLLDPSHLSPVPFDFPS